MKTRESNGRRRPVGAAPRPFLAAALGALRGRTALVALLLLATAAAAVSLFLFGFRSSGPSGPPRAAIVDQLSLTFPNPGFVDSATEMLEQAGYAVDYYPGEQVTVDFFRDLPAGGRDLVIMRAHAGRSLINGEFSDEVSIFTSEPYGQDRHYEEQVQNHLFRVFFPHDEKRYFGIRSDFVRSDMRGDFSDAVVVLMGCNVLKIHDMAEAFVERGAEAVVGWDGPVSASHTDEGTERFLYHLLVEGRTPPEAVSLAMADVGPDPAHGAELAIYPSEAERTAVR